MKVLGNAVLILPDKMPEKTRDGSLVIPENSKEMIPDEGTVIQAGAACEIAKKKDHVKFNRKSASVIVIDGRDYYLIEEHNTMYYEQH
jgi:co-chaperonin GroES (HSP10)